MLLSIIPLKISPVVKRLKHEENVAIFVAILIILAFVLFDKTTLQIHQNNLGTNIGQVAPNIPIKLVNGTNVTLNEFRGRPVVLWFITTGCSSCSQSSQLLKSQYYNQIHSKGAVILTVNLYDNLGTDGFSLKFFANSYGYGLNKTGWIYGTTTQNASYEYDPNAYLDIYYVINSNGTIINEGSPLSTNLNSVVSSL